MGAGALEVGKATSPSPRWGRGVGERGRLNRALSLRRVAPLSLSREGRGTKIKVDAGLLGRADLEDQRLFEHQRAVAGDGLRLSLLVRGG